MSRVGRRYGNCRVFKVQGLREEESGGGRRRNEYRADWQSGGADMEGSEEKINLKSLCEGRMAPKATGLVKSSREGEEGNRVEKSVQRRYDSC